MWSTISLYCCIFVGMKTLAGEEGSFEHAGRIASTWMESMNNSFTTSHHIVDLISLIEHSCPLILEIV